MNRLSKTFWPVQVTPRSAAVAPIDISSRSQKLMLQLGLIKSSTNGTFHLLPIAQRAVDKCTELLSKHMEAIGSQKMTMPILTSSTLWKQTGRFAEGVNEMFLVTDRHSKEYLLSPTHEEAVTSMIGSNGPLSHNQLPLRLYQIGPKFRDETRTRFGLMRAKEFVMKDLYTFDKNLKEAQYTYELVNDTYMSFFKKINVPFVKVVANAGIMGGSTSHEYHFISNTGEDRIHTCTSCDYASNEEALEEIRQCPQCRSPLNLSKGIEIGHTFLLQDKYSHPLGATVLQANGKPTNLQMGCYGIGITRLLAASLEVLSTDSELKWPKLLAPYDICVISAKEGSKEQETSWKYENQLCNNVTELCDPNDILLDDRGNMTIGKRLLDAYRMGYPIIVVIGSQILREPPLLELHVGGVIKNLPISETLSEIGDYMNMKKNLRTDGYEAGSEYLWNKQITLDSKA